MCTTCAIMDCLGQPHVLLLRVDDRMALDDQTPEAWIGVVLDEAFLSLAVARVGGGMVGETYPEGTEWFVNLYGDDVLIASKVVRAVEEETHLSVLTAFAQAHIDSYYAQMSSEDDDHAGDED